MILLHLNSSHPDLDGQPILVNEANVTEVITENGVTKVSSSSHFFQAKYFVKESITDLVHLTQAHILRRIKT